MSMDILFALSGVKHILCCVFVLFVFILCTLCCQFPWIVHFWFPLRYSLTLLYWYYSTGNTVILCLLYNSILCIVSATWLLVTFSFISIWLNFYFLCVHLWFDVEIYLPGVRFFLMYRVIGTKTYGTNLI